MKDLQNFVYKFMEKEQMTLKQALLQSSLGICSKSGNIAEVVRGVVYSDYPYSEERKKLTSEYIGEAFFNLVMLASTTGISPEETISHFLATAIQKNKITREDEMKILAAREKILANDASNKEKPHAQASIIEMLKYVKDNEPINHPSLTTMGKHLREKERTK